MLDHWLAIFCTSGFRTEWVNANNMNQKFFFQQGEIT